MFLCVCMKMFVHVQARLSIIIFNPEPRRKPLAQIMVTKIVWICANARRADEPLSKQIYATRQRTTDHDDRVRRRLAASCDDVRVACDRRRPHATRQRDEDTGSFEHVRPVRCVASRRSVLVSNGAATKSDQRI